jgi:hypothetical protein
MALPPGRTQLDQLIGLFQRALFALAVRPPRTAGLRRVHVGLDVHRLLPSAAADAIRACFDRAIP